MSKLAEFLKTQCPTANAANPANRSAAISSSSNISSGVSANSNVSDDLVARILRMARRWGFSPDELTEDLNRAAADPGRALLWVEHDEQKFGAGETLNARH